MRSNNICPLPGAYQVGEEVSLFSGAKSHLIGKSDMREVEKEFFLPEAYSM
jgi:hypothetical protein